jgi:adenylate cyclase
MKRKISFRVGIIQIFMLLLGVTFIAVSANYYLQTSEILLSMGERVAEQRTNVIVQRTRALLDGPAMYAANLGKRLQRRRYGVDIVDSHRELWESMWEPLAMTPQMQSYFVADQRGSLVEVRRDAKHSTRVIDRSPTGQQPPLDYKIYRDDEYKALSEERIDASYDPRQRPWFLQPGAGDKISWTPVFFSKSTRNPILMVSYPMLSDRGAIKGTSSISVPLYSISDFLTHNPLTAESRAFITRTDGDLLAFYDKDQLFFNEEPMGLRLRTLSEVEDPVLSALNEDILTRLDQNRASALTYKGEEEQTSYRLFVLSLGKDGLTKQGWKLVVVVPQTEAREAQQGIATYQTKVKDFFDQAEDLAFAMAQLFPQNGKALDVVPHHQDHWLKMWDGLLKTPQVQSVLLADLVGSYLQVRREPYLTTRLIDRSWSSDPPYYDLRIHRDDDYAIYTRKRDESDFNILERPWYQQTTAEERIHWSDIYISSTAKTAVITATYPSLDPAFRRTIRAVAGVSIPLHSISEFVAEEQPGTNGMLFIFDDQDNLIAYPDKSQLTIEDEGTLERLRLRKMTEIEEEAPRMFHQAFKHNENNKRFNFEMDGMRYYAIVKEFPAGKGQWNWKVATIISEQDLLGNVDAMLLHSLWIALTIFGIALILLYFTTRFLSDPINRLACEADKLKDLQLDSIHGVHSRYKEIDNMSRALLRARDGLHSFRKYVPDQLVRQLIQTNQLAHLGGKNARLPVFFSDIKGFTELSEAMPPQELMLQLSEYFDELTRIIVEEGGTIDKYIGDSIMAFWGAPIEQPDAPQAACRAALRCQRRLDELNEHWLAQNKPAMHTRIGIHIGNLVVGNVGASQRFNYTVVGDSVNLASRLEGANTLFGTRIIISDALQAELGGDFVVRLLERLAVKGKRQATWIYELVCATDDPLSDDRRNFIDRYQKALANLIENQEPDLALQQFQQLATAYPQDRSVQHMVKRCHKALKNTKGTTDTRTWIWNEK